jgi:hypothetical protein
MPQPSELAGGEGHTFEGDAAAFYLSALLAECFAPGVENRIVVGVSVGQRNFGEPLDDLIVDFQDSEGGLARLSLQVKRSLTISSAAKNKDFREVIRDSWGTLKKANFRRKVDRYGTAVGTITPSKERALKTLCDWARESQTTEHFEARFATGGNAGPGTKAVKNDIVSLLAEIIGAQCSAADVHMFLEHFVLIQLDLLREGATEPPEAINRIRDCLAPEETAKSPMIWSHLVKLARASAGKSGQFDRPRLVREVASLARLRGSNSWRCDLDRICEIARSSAALIPDDVGGTKLHRKSFDDLNAKIDQGRFVQVLGLPGCGKSVVIRKGVESRLERGPVFFLKAEQLNASCWTNYAVSNGLSGNSLTDFLVEIGAVGTPVLFIDSIDRIETQFQGVVIDVVRTIVESPLLNDWRIVVSLRDTGVEVLRNWLGNYLDLVTVETLEVGALGDDEAEELAKARPHLRPLLFGAPQVREIVRRPFFAKVVDQGHLAGRNAKATIPPRSEIDLLGYWWRFGGYAETGQDALERQQTLLGLADIRAAELSQPIRLRQLVSPAKIDALRADGILQDALEGVSVRFSHDIFFEWAFFHVLVDCGPNWIDKIKECGEPPAVGRVVELVSQWEYAQGEQWQHHLARLKNSPLRSQWMRAWLVGPLGSSQFLGNEEQFSRAVFADDFNLFRKVLVWFQAEKTSPNTSVSLSEFPLEERQRYADLLAWPSDFRAWRQLIRFALNRVSEIPPRLHPELIAIFEVWQNAWSAFPNPVSKALLTQCAKWLSPTGEETAAGNTKPMPVDYFNNRYLDDVYLALVQLILTASRSEPNFATEYLERVAQSDRIRGREFEHVVKFSPLLSRTLARPLVEVCLAFLRRELPEDRIERLRRSRSCDSFAQLRAHDAYDDYDWDKLSIHDDYRTFSPPSPLREPFHSLFQYSPENALHLLRELCNHAIACWRQLHSRFQERKGIPIPLELTFPWGTQIFWGGEDEYLWCRGSCAPSAIESGFLALEEWCFSELDRGAPVDDLIQKIVEGNDCITILRVAAMLALQTERMSETTLPLVTSQRLLAADHSRWAQDFSTSTASLIGFSGVADGKHVEAIKVANAREVRKKDLRWLIPRFVFAQGPFSQRVRDAVLDFVNNPPFPYEEHRDLPGAQEYFRLQAQELGDLVDSKNFRAHRISDESDEIAIVYESPSAAKPENIFRAEEATRRLGEGNLWTWASKSFEEGELNNMFALDDAILAAKECDAANLFEHSTEDGDNQGFDMRRGAVAGTAAVVINFRKGRSPEDLEWAREVLSRAINFPEVPHLMWNRHSHISWHPLIFVARGLVAEMRENTPQSRCAEDLLALVAHPLDIVAETVLKELPTVWKALPGLGWTTVWLAFSLCRIQPAQVGRFRGCPSDGEIRARVNAAIDFYDSSSQWHSIPRPPVAWTKVASEVRDNRPYYGNYTDKDVTDTTERWRPSGDLWRSKYAGKILKYIPVEYVLESEAKREYIDYVSDLLAWTIQTNAPPWVKPRRRSRSPVGINIYEWTHSLGAHLGQVAGRLPFEEFKVRFLEPMLGLEGENCWAILNPFVSSYVCSYVFDAEVVPSGSISLLKLCLEKVLQDSVFDCSDYSDGEISGFDLPRLVQTLMFVSIEHAGLASRYVNGDWSEIGLIVPLVDRFVRVAGWSASVMDAFLTLCERSKAEYPVDLFADQILSVFISGPEGLKGWHGTFLASRIAELVQFFACREPPLALPLAQNFLRILDFLVDMGDRRSAALQLSETFREVPIPRT